MLLSVASLCAVLLGFGAAFFVADSGSQSNASSTTSAVQVLPASATGDVSRIPRLKSVATLPPLPKPPPTTVTTTQYTGQTYTGQTYTGPGHGGGSNTTTTGGG